MDVTHISYALKVAREERNNQNQMKSDFYYGYVCMVFKSLVQEYIGNIQTIKAILS